MGHLQGFLRVALSSQAYYSSDVASDHDAVIGSVTFTPRPKLSSLLPLFRSMAHDEKLSTTGSIGFINTEFKVGHWPIFIKFGEAALLVKRGIVEPSPIILFNSVIVTTMETVTVTGV